MTKRKSIVQTAIEAFTTQIQGIRDQIGDLQSERESVDAAPRSRSEIELIVDREIQRVRASNSMEFLALQARTGSFSSFDFDARFERRPFELLASIAPDELRSAILGAVPDEGLTSEERESRLSVLDSEIFRLEVAEELALRELEAGVGRPMMRRPKVNPAILVAPSDELEAIS